MLAIALALQKAGHTRKAAMKFDHNKLPGKNGEATELTVAFSHLNLSIC